MLTFLFKKERQLEALIYNYLKNLGMTQAAVSQAIKRGMIFATENDFSLE